MFLIDLIKQFSEAKVPYAVVGGYAMALQGIVRATMDIDLVISLKENHLQRAEGILNHLGLESRIPVRASEMSQFHEKFRKEKNLLAWSFVDPADPSRVVDLLIHPPLNKIKTARISVHGLTVIVADLKSIARMKKSTGRPADQHDVLRIEEHLNAKKQKR